MKSDSPKAILIDLWGTLIYSNKFKENVEILKRDILYPNNCDEKQLFKTWQSLWFKKESSIHERNKKMIELHQLNVNESDFAKLTKLSPDMVSLFEESIPFLNEFKRSGYFIFAVSDCGQDTYKYVKNSRLNDYFSGLYLSYKYKTTKEEELYDRLLDTIKMSKDRLIMIGDDFKRDFIMPESKGISAIFLDRHKKIPKSNKVIHTLTDFLRLNNYE